MYPNHNTHGPRIYSASEILDMHFPSVPSIIEGLLPVGLTILGGAPKVGKSWMALQIALCMATGQPFLDRPVQSGAVLYLALEDSRQRLQRRMLEQEWPSTQSVGFIPMDQLGERMDYLNRGGISTLKEYLQSGNYRVLFIDTVSRSIQGDKNEEALMTPAFALLQTLAHEHNLAIVMIDHMRKGRDDLKDPIDDILGSVAKGATADSIWGLYRKSGQAGATLVVTGRDIAEDSLSIRFEAARGVWQLQGSSQTVSPNEATILAYLAGQNTRCSATEISTALERDRSNVNKDLQNLAHKGLLRREVEGRHFYYSAI